MSTPQKYLVTPALPYANGDAHLGHLVEHIQVNVFVRALRMAGEDVLYVCGADTHGTPVELSARKAGEDPADYVEKIRQNFDATFKRYQIEFDGGYGSTHSDLNRQHAGRVYQSLKDAGHVVKKTTQQLFDPKEGRFLPDRLVRGTCPKCGAEDQYGDSCENCNSTYEPTDLKNARSAISDATPELRDSEQIYVELAKYTPLLEEWMASDGPFNGHPVAGPIQNFLRGWIDGGLNDWCISREGPYFGFEIPGEANKYFYVWLDAPIGYMSLTEKAAKEKGRTFEEYWNDPSTKIYHFIGKDIVYFHTLFWPAMLSAAGHTLPTAVAVHGYLTVDGVKMSKSRGTFINADTVYDELGQIGAEAIRYYLAAKLNGSIDDIDLNLKDFVARTNADLVNTIVNLVSRTVPMLHRHSDGKVGTFDPEAEEMIANVRSLAEPVEGWYRSLDNARVVRQIVSIAAEGNKYMQDGKPWEVGKTDPAKAQQMLTTALWVGKVCLALLKPILPRVATDLEALLNVDAFTFENALAPLEDGAAINKYEHLFKRLDQKAVDALVKPAEEAPKKNDAKGKKAKKKAEKKDEGPIDIDAFMAVELRAAKVIKATDVEGADKLISCTLDVGPLGERHVFTGLKPHVQPSELEGKMVVLVANLAPRKMKFGMSEGMILAGGDKPPVPLFCEGCSPGDRIR